MLISTIRNHNGRLICLFISCIWGVTAIAQPWQSTPNNTNNIYNTNTGNVGVGTSSPQTLLGVNGRGAAGGQSANLGLAQVAAALRNLQGSGKMVLGWNATGNKCESDFVTNTYNNNSLGGFYFWNYNSVGALTNLFNITSSGSVGIGTQVPAAQFESYTGQLNSNQGSIGKMARFTASVSNYMQLRVTANRFATGSDWHEVSIRMQAWTDATPQAFIDFNPNGNGAGIAVGTQNVESMRILTGGSVLIGKTSQTNSGYLLDVNGNVRANEVVVTTTGADYVFDLGYHLSSLKALETYITKEHRLPGIAPAARMEQEGLNLGDNQTLLLAKIEELTLYLIQQDKGTGAERKDQGFGAAEPDPRRSGRAY